VNITTKARSVPAVHWLCSHAIKKTSSGGSSVQRDELRGIERDRRGRS
jgi:hypothetical protein